MWTGFGKFFARTTNLTSSTLAQEIAIDTPVFGFQLNTDDEDARNARGWVNGKLQTLASAPGAQSDLLVTKFEFIDWNLLQFTEDELATNVNVTLPIYYKGTVPLIAPYEIANPKVTAANAAKITCSLLEKGTWGAPGHLSRAAAAPTGRQFQADGAGAKLVFPATMAGAAVIYVLDEPLVALPSIGKAGSAISYGTLEFAGVAYTPGSQKGTMIHIPNIQRRTRPSKSSEDDVPTFEIEWSCVVKPGERKAVHYYDLDAIA